MKSITVILAAVFIVLAGVSLPVIAQEYDVSESFYEGEESYFEGDEDDEYVENVEEYENLQRNAEVDIDYFYKQLSPYGEWIWVPEYDWVWRPFNMKSDWRPYTYGRWAHTDVGWTWSSNFEWGWAPFHYGRWNYLDPFGWIWMPGTVWAPAWVVWRYSDQYVGWAPILSGYDTSFGWAYYPVHYHHWNFLAWNAFYEPHPYHHFISARRLRNTFHRTYYPRRCRSKGGLSCLRGPSRKLVVRRLGRPVKSMKLRHVAIGSGNMRRSSARMGIERDVMLIHRPRFRKGSKRLEVNRSKGHVPNGSRARGSIRQSRPAHSGEALKRSSPSRRGVKRRQRFDKAPTRQPTSRNIQPRKPSPGKFITPKKSSSPRPYQSIPTKNLLTPKPNPSKSTNTRKHEAKPRNSSSHNVRSKTINIPRRSASPSRSSSRSLRTPKRR